MEQVTSAIPESTVDENKYAMTFMLSFKPENVTPGSLIIDLYANGETYPVLLSVPLGYEVPFENTGDVKKIIETLMKGGAKFTDDWRIVSTFLVHKVILIDDMYRFEFGEVVCVPHVDEDGFVSDYQVLADDTELDMSVHRIDRHLIVVHDKISNEDITVHMVTEDQPVKTGDCIATIFDIDTKENFIYNLYNYKRKDDEEKTNYICAMVWLTQTQSLGQFSFMTGDFSLAKSDLGDIDPGYLAATVTEPDGTEYDFEIPKEHYIASLH
ncbi:hypothetical protein KODAMA_02800 [Serratia phage vB_SmaM-Kodama]|nr:hypothetical protein KODAMA_02800 [Serratia phage vB_SmaM-Kodama]